MSVENVLVFKIDTKKTCVHLLNKLKDASLQYIAAGCFLYGGKRFYKRRESISFLIRKTTDRKVVEWQVMTT